MQHSDWYSHAQEACLLLPIRSGWNYPPPKKWNNGEYTAPSIQTILDLGKNIGVGMREGYILVDADSAEKVAEIEADLGGVKTLSTTTPRGVQWVFSGGKGIGQTAGKSAYGEGVDVRTAMDGYGMGPGSVRTLKSYTKRDGDESKAPDTNGGPWSN